jgi:hypothetical protein
LVARQPAHCAPLTADRCRRTLRSARRSWMASSLLRADMSMPLTVGHISATLTASNETSLRPMRSSIGHYESPNLRYSFGVTLPQYDQSSGFSGEDRDCLFWARRHRCSSGPISNWGRLPTPLRSFREPSFLHNSGHRRRHSQSAFEMISILVSQHAFHGPWLIVNSKLVHDGGAGIVHADDLDLGACASELEHRHVDGVYAGEVP